LTGQNWVELVVLVLCIFFAALASGTETALTSVNRLRVRHLAEDGSARAATLQRLQQDPQRFLGTVLIVNTFALIIASAAATLLGIEVDRIFASTLFVSSALGGLAGLLFGLALSDISPYIGRDQVELKGLAVIVLGGMGSIPGAVVGGYLLGLIEVLAFVRFGSNVEAGVAFAALFLMLVIRPQGLFGARLKERI